jgi:hypothetical protein
MLLSAVTTGYSQDVKFPTASPEHIEALRTGDYDLVNLEPTGRLRKVVFRRPLAKVTHASLMIYPNPATKEIHVKIPDINASGFQLSVYNQSGQKQLSQVYEADKVDVSSLSAGTYIVYVTNGKQTFSQTLIVAK